MKLHAQVSLALLSAALFAAGNAQAQLKAPPVAPPPTSLPNVAQPNTPPDPLTKEFHACLQKLQDASQQTKKPADPAAAQACFVAETKRQEARISAGTVKVDQSLKPAEKKRLDDANVAWRHFRDVECLFFADPKDSPVESASNAQCVLDRTIRRALDMDGLAMAVSQQGTRPGAGAPPSAPAPAPAK